MTAFGPDMPRFAELAPGVRRLLAPNPSMMTGPGTNTYLFGVSEVAVIDPGPEIDSHIDRIVEAAAAPIRWVLVTHTHPDHSPGAMPLAARTGAEVLGLPAPEQQDEERPNRQHDRRSDHEGEDASRVEPGEGHHGQVDPLARDGLARGIPAGGLGHGDHVHDVVAVEDRVDPPGERGRVARCQLFDVLGPLRGPVLGIDDIPLLVEVDDVAPVAVYEFRNLGHQAGLVGTVN